MLQKNFFLTKIFRRIFILFALSISLLVLVYSYATIQMQKKSNLEVLHSKASTLANSIALVCHDAMLKDDMSFIVEYDLNVLKRNKEVLEIIVTNTSNQNIKVSKKGWRLFSKVSQNLKKMQQSKEVYTIRYSEELQQNVFHYVYPVKLPGVDWGYIHIIYSLESYNAALDSMYRSTAALLGVLFFVTLFISYIISKEIALPILKLSKAAEDVASGKLEVRVDIKRDDEIGELAKNFNEMVNKLEHSHEELESLVFQRTRELEHLNKDLDNKIKEAIMENSKKEQMLIQQSRLAAMGEMIGNIAHQWRQPLNALGLVIQNIYYAYESDTLDKEHLERSMQKSKKLTELMSKTIDDFRNFFRPDKTTEVFSIAERIENALDLISASYKSHNIEVESSLDASLKASGYPNEFSQVLLNIFTNAKDILITNHIQNPKVWVRSFLNKNKIVVEIEDNGGGIDPQIMDKIFEPYFTTKDKNVGTGIGLYMSKMIIENNMGGTIYAYNGKYGAIFRIEMPQEGSNDE